MCRKLWVNSGASSPDFTHRSCLKTASVRRLAPATQRTGAAPVTSFCCCSFKEAELSLGSLCDAHTEDVGRKHRSDHASQSHRRTTRQRDPDAPRFATLMSRSGRSPRISAPRPSQRRPARRRNLRRGI